MSEVAVEAAQAKSVMPVKRPLEGRIIPIRGSRTLAGGTARTRSGGPDLVRNDIPFAIVRISGPAVPVAVPGPG